MKIFLLGGDENWKKRIRDNLSFDCVFAPKEKSHITIKTNVYNTFTADVVVFWTDETTLIGEKSYEILQSVNGNENQLLIFVSDGRVQSNVLSFASRRLDEAIFLDNVDDIFDVIQFILPNKVVET